MMHPDQLRFILIFVIAGTFLFAGRIAAIVLLHLR